MKLRELLRRGAGCRLRARGDGGGQLTETKKKEYRLAPNDAEVSAECRSPRQQMVKPLCWGVDWNTFQSAKLLEVCFRFQVRKMWIIDLQKNNFNLTVSSLMILTPFACGIPAWLTQSGRSPKGGSLCYLLVSVTCLMSWFLCL